MKGDREGSNPRLYDKEGYTLYTALVQLRYFGMATPRIISQCFELKTIYISYNMLPDYVL